MQICITTYSGYAPYCWIHARGWSKTKAIQSSRIPWAWSQLVLHAWKGQFLHQAPDLLSVARQQVIGRRSDCFHLLTGKTAMLLYCVDWPSSYIYTFTSAGQGVPCRDAASCTRCLVWKIQSGRRRIQTLNGRCPLSWLNGKLPTRRRGLRDWLEEHGALTMNSKPAPSACIWSSGCTPLAQLTTRQTTSSPHMSVSTCQYVSLMTFRTDTPPARVVRLAPGWWNLLVACPVISFVATVMSHCFLLEFYLCAAVFYWRPCVPVGSCSMRLNG